MSRSSVSEGEEQCLVLRLIIFFKSFKLLDYLIFTLLIGKNLI